MRSSILGCLTHVSHRSPRQGASPQPFGTFSALAGLGQLTGTLDNIVANAPEHRGQLEFLLPLSWGPRSSCSSMAGPLPGVPGRGGTAAAALPSILLPFCNEQQWGFIII